MCNKTNYLKSGLQGIDPCMTNFIDNLNLLFKDVPSLNIVACCCGHGKYPMTIVLKNQISFKCYDLVSSKTIPREKRFYEKDKQGYYFIPETIK